MNPDIAAKAAVLSGLRKGQAVISIGDVHGWQRPPPYTAAVAMLYACRELERTVPAAPPPAAKPKDLERWVAATVEVRHQEETRRDVVAELLLNWERETAAAGLAAIPDYTARLATAFDELVEQFDAHADAPRTLTGHESTEEVEAHTSALRVASALANAVMQRAVLADGAGEAGDIGGDILWLVLAPNPTATHDQVQDALKAFTHRFPQSLDEWDALRPLGLRLAQLGEVAARRERHTAFMHWVGMSTADMGMRDHSYSEYVEDNPGPQPGLQRQAETDSMFNNSPSLSI